MQPLREKRQSIHVIGSLDLVQTLFADRLFDQLNLWNVDVVHSVRGRPSMIFDAKYKAASASGASPNADHSQRGPLPNPGLLHRAWGAPCLARLRRRRTAPFPPSTEHRSVRWIFLGNRRLCWRGWVI